MASKTGRISGALLFCMISFKLPARAQESTYSADSLMATFERDSKASLKGVVISFRDVVVESKNSKVIFKSSDTSKVICELVGSAGYQSKPPSVGGQVTVIGKVRGRGLLGNVTLDDCSIAASAASTASTEPAPQEAASAPPDRISEENTGADSLPKLPEEPEKEVEITRSVRPAKPRTPTVKETISSSGVEHQDQTTKKSSEPPPAVPYKFYASLVLSGALGYAILSKLLGAALTATRYSRASSTFNTAEVRQAALEALLKDENKK